MRINIDTLKTTAQVVREGRQFITAVIDTADRPVLVLDKHLSVQAANEAFYRNFKVKPEDTINRRVYELGDGHWDIPKLRTLLETILPQNSSFKEFEVEHHFPSIGKKRLLLDAQRLSIQGDRNGLILLGIDDAAEPLAK